MKVALLTDGIWPDTIGGMQKHSYYLSKYLAKRGVSVDVYTSGNAVDKSVSDANGDESSKRFVNIIKIKKPTGKRFPGHYLWELFHFSKLAYEKLEPAIGEYDVVYAQGLAGWYTVTRKKHDTPILLNFHGLNMFQKAQSLRSKTEQAMFRPFVKKMLTNADYVQSLGGRLTRILTDNGVGENRIFELGIGIETDWITPSDKKEKAIKTFVFIGRFDKVKGIDELNSVIKSLLQKHRFEFHFVGPIPQKIQVGADNIIYHGEIKDAVRIKSILKESDFLVAPSHSEGMPTVILEAMACGNGIIATDVGAVAELVSSENGILIPPFDKEALRNALNSAIEMRHVDLVKMKQSSIESVKTRFLWDVLIDDMLSVFQKVKIERRTCLVE